MVILVWAGEKWVNFIRGPICYKNRGVLALLLSDPPPLSFNPAFILLYDFDNESPGE